MIAIYRLLLSIAALVGLPALFLQAKRRGGYGAQASNLFGFTGAVPPKVAGVRRIWIQAASVGELLAIGPVIRGLAASPTTEVVLTTTTATGRRVAHEHFSGLAVYIGVFPLDLWSTSAAAWKRLQPDAVALVEGELWPEHLHQAARRGVPVYLINARMSERSFRRFRKLGAITRGLLQPLTTILAATESDFRRYAALELDAKVVVTGCLKFDFDPAPFLSGSEKAAMLRECGLLAPSTEPTGALPPVLLGASTWPGEERCLTEIFADLRNAYPDLRLILVPRHAERRAEIAADLAALDRQDPALQPVFRSMTTPPAPERLIYVADTTGELRRFLQTATVVFVGKSLPPHTDGQTPLEAIAYGKPVLFGPGMRNFSDISKSLVERKAALRVADSEALREAVTSLLAAPAERQRMSEAGRAWFAENQGAVTRTLAHLLKEDNL